MFSVILYKAGLLAQNLNLINFNEHGNKIQFFPRCIEICLHASQSAATVDYGNIIFLDQFAVSV